MAQEPRLMAFEQALKDEGIAGTQLESVARSIFQQESSSGKNVKTSNAGARGPMQVLPATFKAYNPKGNIDDPYDNSVGGLRYIKDLFSKTNDAGLTAVGYYGGPKAIEKAKAGVAVRDPRNPNAPDTLQYMEQVMGRTKGTPARGRARPPVPKAIEINAPELGPNYQAALALMAKADDLSDAREKIAQEEEDNSVADFSQARQMLAQIKPTTGFVAQEPRRMANGGFVVPYQTTIYRPDERKQYEQNRQSWLDYQRQVDEYNAALEAYKTSAPVTEYEKQRLAYNEAMNQYKTNVYDPFVQQATQYNTALEAYNKQAEAWNALPTDYINRVKIGGVIPSGRFVYIADLLKANAMPTFHAIPTGYEYVHTGAEGGGYLAGKSQPKPVFNMTAPTEPAPFSMEQPKAPDPFTGQVPATPTVSQEELLAFKQQMEANAKKDAEQRKIALDVANNPAAYNLAGFGAAGINAPSLFAEGGEAKKESPSMGEKVKGTAKEILRSMQYTPYDLLGAPVDVINLGLKGVDYVTGSKLATDKPVGGSDYLIQKSRELGIADEPTGSTTETLTRLGTGILSPTAGPKAIVAAGKAAKGTAKAALEDLAMAGTGQGGSKIAQKIMEPGTAFAVRPKGGVFLGARSIDEPPLTNFDIQLRRFTEDLDRADPQQEAVVNFLDKKFRNYVSKDMGTADDPVFKKMLTGEIPNHTFATAQELTAARAGNPIALHKVRNAYDASLNLNFYVGENIAKQLGKGKEYGYIVKQEDLIKKKIKEQSPQSPSELMVSGNVLGQEQLEKYPTLYGSPGFKQMVEESESGALMRMMNKSDLPPHIRQAITQGEPVFAQTSSVRGVFDITELRDYLLTRNPNDIKNMGVADAIAKSKQWHAQMEAARRDPSKFSPKVLFEGTKEVLPVGEGYKWVDVKTPDALSLEGNIMGHCVGGSNYCNAVSKETTKIISLRDKKGVPHVTIEIQKDSDGKFSRIAQIKGTGNNSPEKYFDEVDAFLKDYSAKMGGDLSITERPNFVPPDWRYK